MADTVEVRMLIGADWRRGEQLHTIVDPYRGDVVAYAPESTLADLDDALAAASAGKDVIAAMPARERAALLRRVQALLVERTEELATILSRETGKAIADSRTEIARSIDTLGLSAEEAIRIEGEHVPLEGSAQGEGKLAWLLRFPVGIVAGITPFNAPVNLACHKLAPAIAAGNAILLKAPPQSPLVVARLVELFVEAGTPAGVIGLLFGNTVGPALVRDPRVDFVSFTGSSAVGAAIKASSGLKRVALELGGNGSTIVHEDGDVKLAASLCARNSMRLAGQSCISVQNTFVHQRHYDTFVALVQQEVARLRCGDPLDPATDVGTLIDEAAAIRVETWVKEAVAAGATLLCGGTRTGAQFQPTVLVNVKPTMRVVCEEIFGPVMTVRPYTDLDATFAEVNGTQYGLQTGIFTSSIETAVRAVRKLRVGGVIINGTSTWRTDQMPYGGIKASGIGREGPRYAIRDMTEERLVVFNQ